LASSGGGARNPLQGHCIRDRLTAVLYVFGRIQYSKSLSIIELTTNADATTSPSRIDWLIE